eukprot:gnl/TRDRNA2_/TRDRNA2_188643_c0_seq1.p1 gnl/TRDRNA2_/TRDRNA2_188643_c0~~gnl/TRDRNA2_/TRDRNA2_188643_c0_seq1.p1  ORF type:complete len:333 (+),score=78.76 gnl/TRDRNA2_/TRDRNA2_188643_c0_seq1:88-1086(+)
MPPKFVLDDTEDNSMTSATWSISADGSMRHKRTDVHISPEEGISVEGHEWRINEDDIELENEHLGQGAGGVVTKGRLRTTGEAVALKTIKVDEKQKREQLLNEIGGLIKAEASPYLVTWKGAFVSKKSGAVHVALELMDRGSLASLKKRLKGQGVPPRHLACITQQIMLGLDHLHTRRLLHRDIKPENVLHNSRGEVKLTDFGIAKDLDSTMAMAGTFVGTVTYMSPERCLGNDYSLASDIWSVGMVIYELACGSYPFADVSSFPVLFEHLCEKPEPRLDPATYPPDLCDFVALCLTRDEAGRPDTRTLVGHPFINVNVGTVDELAAWLPAE